jgi:hypothetical protein
MVRWRMVMLGPSVKLAKGMRAEFGEGGAK